MLVLIGFLALNACKKDDVYMVPDVIQPYIDEFIRQGALRGIDITINDLIVLFENDLEVDGVDAAGVCQFGSKKSTPTIKLDSTSVNWKANLASREQLVFHELGHCILDRGHEDDRLGNDNYRSTMRASGEQLYGLKFSEFKKHYYLDELYQPTIGPPNWSIGVLDYDDVLPSSKTEAFVEDFSDESGGWSVGTSENTKRSISNGRYELEVISPGNYFVANTIEIDDEQDFEIEVNIRIFGGGFAGVLWGGEDRPGSIPTFHSLFYDADVASIGTIEFGTESSYVFGDNISSAFNRVVVRKIGSDYLYYLNDERIDNMEFFSLDGNEFGLSFGGETGVKVLIEDIILYYVN